MKREFKFENIICEENISLSLVNGKIELEHSTVIIYISKNIAFIKNDWQLLSYLFFLSSVNYLFSIFPFFSIAVYVLLADLQGFLVK